VIDSKGDVRSCAEGKIQQATDEGTVWGLCEAVDVKTGRLWIVEGWAGETKTGFHGCRRGIGVGLMELGNETIYQCGLGKSNGTSFCIADDTYPKAKFDLAQIRDRPSRAQLVLKGRVGGGGRPSANHIVDVDGYKVRDVVDDADIDAPLAQESSESPRKHGIVHLTIPDVSTLLQTVQAFQQFPYPALLPSFLKVFGLACILDVVGGEGGVKEGGLYVDLLDVPSASCSDVEYRTKGLEVRCG
jgi:hypothetical protein